MKLHTVFITHNRLELTKQALESYWLTVTLPHTLIVVDNASTDGSVEWLREMEEQRMLSALFLPENRYPGFACNQGWQRTPSSADFLQRADNDFRFLPGWCEEVEFCFQNVNLGQLGLRTDEEEQFASLNVGGNCIIRRALWDQGLRYDETPWPELPPGYSEDSYFSPQVKKMGYEWARVQRPCIESLASGDWKDPYYQRSYGDRGIVPHPDDPTLPGTQ